MRLLKKIDDFFFLGEGNMSDRIFYYSMYIVLIVIVITVISA